MRAMVLSRVGQPLMDSNVADPQPGAGEVLVRVEACAVCRTDLHVLDGELAHPKLPLIPGHEIVGRVAGSGPGTQRFAVGTRIGVPWLGSTCGKCEYCRAGRENLCDQPQFTGYTRDGGYAELVVANENFCVVIPERYESAKAAPLLCAGLIGFRSYSKTGDARRLGLYGFGAAAHLLTQLAVAEGREVYAFTRPGDVQGQQFARELGAVWADDSRQSPPEQLDAAILFAPAGELVPRALHAVKKGGIVVCGGIHMSDIPQFPYALLWGERKLLSVANLTRDDATRYMQVIEDVPLRIHVQEFPLSQGNEALARLRSGRVQGAAVLVL